MKKFLLMMLTGMLFANTATAGEIRLHTFEQGGAAKASEVNENFQALKTKAEEQAKIIAELQKQVQEISGKNGEGVQVQPPKIPKGGISEEADGIHFTAIGCQRNSNGVKCTLKLTSLKEDRYILVAGRGAINGEQYSSIIYDSSGNRYLPNTANLSGATTGSYGMSRALIADIPTKLEFTVAKLDKTATFIAVIGVKYTLDGNADNYKIMRLRNIPIK